MNILITGGTGLLGKEITRVLLAKHYQVGILTRSKKGMSGIKEFTWSVEDNRIDPEAIPWADYIINLAGENVGQRWTEKTKQKILQSRLTSARILADELANQTHHVKGLLTASAVGYYGANSGDTLVNESGEKGEGFLADVVDQWEKAIDIAAPYVDRLVKLRIGIVLTAQGGALAKMTLPIKYSIGSPLGDGKQWMSWIDVADLANMFLFAIDQPIDGVYNAVAPEPVTNASLTKAIARQLNKPLFMPNVPAFVLKIMLGEMSSMVLGGNKASSVAIQQEGFKFEFAKLEDSLQHLF